MAQGKTKAKQRYLKRKKDRRKHKSKVLGEQQTEEVAARKDVEVNEDDSVLPQSDDSESASRPDITKRPKKRPRLEDEGDENAMIVNENEPSPSPPSRTFPSPEIAAALPSFPLPALPDAPSKSDLALLGLDQALVGADIVPPSTVLPIPTGKEDGGTRLSGRTRKRLRDIGITELFAGEATEVKYCDFTEDVLKCKRLSCPFSYLPRRAQTNFIDPSILLVTSVCLLQQGAVKRWLMCYQLLK